MAVTATSFRIDFPEFRSIPDYPTSVINYYLTLAGFLLNAQRFGGTVPSVSNPPSCMYDMAMELFVAHHVAIEKQAMNAAAGGGVPGVTTGPITAKGVGPVSVSYASGDVIDATAGFWNQTMYGLRFWRLIMMFGAGPIQVGVGATPWYSVGAWPGPLVWPGWQG